MDPLEYLRALRRRWALIALGVVLGGAAGWVTTRVTPVLPATVQYKASSILFNANTSSSSSSSSSSDLGSLDTLAALTTVGEIPVQAAKDLHYDGSPYDLAAQVQPTADRNTGLLTITSISKDLITVE